MLWHHAADSNNVCDCEPTWSQHVDQCMVLVISDNIHWVITWLVSVHETHWHDACQNQEHITCRDSLARVQLASIIMYLCFWCLSWSSLEGCLCSLDWTTGLDCWTGLLDCEMRGQRSSPTYVRMRIKKHVWFSSFSICNGGVWCVLSRGKISLNQDTCLRVFTVCSEH